MLDSPRAPRSRRGVARARFVEEAVIPREVEVAAWPQQPETIRAELPQAARAG
jgi:hypothetical protein